MPIVVPKSSEKATFGTTIGIIRLGNGLCMQLERHCPEKQIPTTALGSGRDVCYSMQLVTPSVVARAVRMLISI